MMVSNKPSENNKRGFNQMANRQRFKPGVGKQNNNRSMNAMFNANQLGDNPGFMDFNDDSINANMNGAGIGAGGPSVGNASDVANKNAGRKMNPNMRRPMKNGAPGMRPRMNGGMQAWGPPNMAPPNMFPPGRRGPMSPPLIPPHPPHPFRNVHGGGMRMRGPQNGRFGGRPPGPMSLLAMNRSPLPAPIPPMAARPMLPPHATGRMMPPPLRHGPADGPMRRNANGNMQGRGMHAFPRNGMPTGGPALNMNGKRPRPKSVQNREEYPLDKPWVTEGIKAEHDKKADLANRLKGHRDDALFAQFKEHRDKFVKMYEAARIEFEKKAPAQDVEKILTDTSSSPCKKARSESVGKSNDAAASTEMSNGTSSSSSAPESASAGTSVDATDDTTECATPAGGSTVASLVSAFSAASSPANASPLDTTAISTTSLANDKPEEAVPLVSDGPAVAMEAGKTAPSTAEVS